YCDN
ncbi:hypothetical protein D030_2446B, partial [Vibrio parahaemolyticus AQ3810]